LLRLLSRTQRLHWRSSRDLRCGHLAALKGRQFISRDRLHRRRLRNDSELRQRRRWRVQSRRCRPRTHATSAPIHSQISNGLGRPLRILPTCGNGRVAEGRQRRATTALHSGVNRLGPRWRHRCVRTAHWLRRLRATRRDTRQHRRALHRLQVQRLPGLRRLALARGGGCTTHSREHRANHRQGRIIPRSMRALRTNGLRWSRARCNSASLCRWWRRWLAHCDGCLGLAALLLLFCGLFLRTALRGILALPRARGHVGVRRFRCSVAGCSRGGRGRKEQRRGGSSVRTSRGGGRTLVGDGRVGEHQVCHRRRTRQRSGHRTRRSDLFRLTGAPTLLAASCRCIATRRGSRRLRLVRLRVRVNLRKPHRLIDVLEFVLLPHRRRWLLQLLLLWHRLVLLVGHAVLEEGRRGVAGVGMGAHQRCRGGATTGMTGMARRSSGGGCRDGSKARRSSRPHRCWRSRTGGPSGSRGRHAAVL